MGFTALFGRSSLVKAFGSRCPGVAFPVSLQWVHCAPWGLCCFCEVERFVLCLGRSVSGSDCPRGGCSLEVAPWPCQHQACLVCRPLAPCVVSRTYWLEVEVSVGAHCSALTWQMCMPGPQKQSCSVASCFVTSQVGTPGHKAGNLSLVETQIPGEPSFPTETCFVYEWMFPGGFRPLVWFSLSKDGRKRATQPAEAVGLHFTRWLCLSCVVCGRDRE